MKMSQQVTNHVGLWSMSFRSYVGGVRVAYSHCILGV